MENNIDKIYDKILFTKEFCIKEMQSIQNNWNLLNKGNYLNLIKGLGILYTYCPSELKSQTLSLINELNTRYKFIIGNENESNKEK